MSFECSVAVVAGGLSFEREISLRSGERVAQALREKGYRVSELDADDRLVESLQEGHFDCAFLALHGRFGEDGTVAALLELLGLPYTGSGFDASRLAFDKLAAKSVLRRAGIPVPEAIPVGEGALRELGIGVLLDRALDQLGLPVVVKPNRGGSALGIRMVERAEQLPAALMTAFGYDDTVLLERRIIGKELALAIVDGLAPLPVVEIHPKQGWYDFGARYTHGAVDFRVPAEISATLAERCRSIALGAHLALGCRDLSRVDAIVDDDETCWVLEVNSGPGLTTTSAVPMAADAAGISFEDLAAHLTNRAIARRPR
jgi:D-alanine-D-alanine ligase